MEGEGENHVNGIMNRSELKNSDKRERRNEKKKKKKYVKKKKKLQE